MLNVIITPVVADFTSSVTGVAPEVPSLVLSAARGIVLDDGIAPALALSLAADTVSHDLGTVTQAEAIDIAKAAATLHSLS